LTVEAAVWRKAMMHLSVKKTAHIRISCINMVWTDVIDMAKFCFSVQIMDFAGVLV